ncbi:MAG: 30S ribosome-binding factor RbfA [Planctomycetes bacterium]|jgi:ribosome-binding factor A|nr:30S ribosome-binding factor RbfA [Planctomycetota bacterium]MBT6453333.1 30S ribosome-binding factor RbfA [Planctomycetota bacterium]MBT6540015.1 30S ribosome-binding factor RbfA [Planctomycetota bacterium]MBT6785444.1 30S ribosome-binding factor RbfA [Planctomycetota bacterium]MBT6967672.1 30S ribosome-binding factor RbfA [Planctomycetota bacterium]
MKSIRRARIASQLREEISRIIQFDLKDPRIGFLSVLSVEPTVDLKECKVYVSIMGKESQQRTSMRGLEAARGKIQSLLITQIRLRETPILRFILDESHQKSQAIEDVIKAARDEDEKAALEREERSSPDQDEEQG